MLDPLDTEVDAAHSCDVEMDQRFAEYMRDILLKDQMFVGEVVNSNKKKKQCDIKLPVDISLPDGSNIGMVHCNNANYANKTFVRFSLTYRKSDDLASSSLAMLEVDRIEATTSRDAFKSWGENYKPNDGVNLVSLLQEKIEGYKNYDQLKQELKIANDDWVKEQARQCGQLEADRRRLDEERADFKSKKESTLEQLEQSGGERLWNLLQPILSEDEEQQRQVAQIDEPLSLKEIATQVHEALEQRGYQAEGALIRQALLATCVAATTGQFVVLSGPPGSGKTSLTSNLAATLGAGYAAVPVRPAWIDPTDLLGFYNPNVERYQPTPFFDKLLEAENYSNAGRLYFLVLDEMNLGRVENYAADFMAKLEKSREQNGSDIAQEASIDLYSQEMHSRLRAKQEQLCGLSSSDELKNVAQSLEGCLLKKHLERYKPNIQIPKGLVLFGTINLDESTYHLSPKFLDRALVIQVSPENIADPLSFQRISEKIELPLACEIAHDAPSDTEGCPKEKWELIWEDVKHWDGYYLRPLGIRLSHRFGQTFRAWMNVAYKLEIEANEAADIFFLTKLLPVISFRADEEPETVTSTQADKAKQSTKKEVLEQWGGDEKVSKYDLTQKPLRLLQIAAGL